MFTGSRQPSSAEPGLWETFGVLTPYLLRPDITDLFITATGELWSDGGPGGLERIRDWQADEPEVRRLAVQLIARGGRHIDESKPYN